MCWRAFLRSQNAWARVRLVISDQHACLVVVLGRVFQGLVTRLCRAIRHGEASRLRYPASRLRSRETRLDAPRPRPSKLSCEFNSRHPLHSRRAPGHSGTWVSPWRPLIGMPRRWGGH